MTNKEDSVEVEASREPRLAALLAVHLVSQVLDEAYVIANAATESGQPWRYLEILKNLRSGHLRDVEEKDVTFCTSKIEGDDAVDNKIAAANIIATSTPQKLTMGEMLSKVMNETSFIGQGEMLSKMMNETSFIGQGDEDTDMRQNELTKSTSMFINHLFDMSEVERVIICDDTEVIQSDSNDLLTEAMTKIMESYVNTALGIAFGQEHPTIDSLAGEISPSTQNSGYSFLADAELGNDDAFYVNKEAKYEECRPSSSGATEKDTAKITNDTVKNDDVAYYENTYLTLNRDYDQCSDGDGETILHDTKGMSLHEVELMTMNTSNDNSPRETEEPQLKSRELTAVSAVSASSRKSKSSLVQRCRTQGARLLACLRGWWRRKTPGKRKEARLPGSVRGLCPLSPDARRRAASLLDQRKLCSSPQAGEHVVWKFNTVSEALVNSSRWKNYTFDVTPDECGEY